MKSIVNEASKKLTKLCDFTSLSVSLAFEAILGGGASLRHGVFFRGGRLILTLHLKGAFIRFRALNRSFTVSQTPL